MKKKIAVFTATRAEYGLLYWLLKDINEDKDLILQLLVSGTHLSPEFGETYKQIEIDGFNINEKVEILLSSDSPVGVAKSMGLGLLGFSEALNRLDPDLLIILGDRFEALAAAQTAMILRIPILHIHGGEITEGAYDDAIRHAITKLSSLHATSTKEYRNRVIQLGESPDRVFNVGALGLDYLTHGEFLSVIELSDSLNFSITKPYFVLTYHPVTLADESQEKTLNNILAALDNFQETQVIITYPNSDDGGRRLITIIEDYAANRKDKALVVPSLGQKRYLSALKHSVAVIGNSSSGIIEAPSLCVPSINIGSRQKGRISAKSVVHCDTDYHSIFKEITNALNIKKSGVNLKFDNPYFNGGASKKILNIIKNESFEVIKSFFDIRVIQ